MKTRSAVVAGLALAVLTLAREGAYGETFRLDLDFNRHHTSWTSQVHNKAKSSGDISFANRPVFCEVSCLPSSVVCDEIRSVLFGATGVRTPGSVDCTISIDAGSPPFCYTPLYKQAHFDLNFDGAFHVSDGEAKQDMTVSGSAAGEASAKGMISCLTFRRMAGVEAGELIRDEINRALRAN